MKKLLNRTTSKPAKFYPYFLRNGDQRLLHKKRTCLLFSELKFESVLPPLKKSSTEDGLHLFFSNMKETFSVPSLSINGSKLYHICILILNFKFVSCFPKKLFS